MPGVLVWGKYGHFILGWVLYNVLCADSAKLWAGVCCVGFNFLKYLGLNIKIIGLMPMH